MDLQNGRIKSVIEQSFVCIIPMPHAPPPSFFSFIVNKIDVDHDGFVTVDEMKNWIKHAQKRWIYDDVDRQWLAHDLNSDSFVSWEEYRNATYGYILGMCICGNNLYIYR